MNKILIESAIISAIKLISDELESLTNDELQSEYEITLAQLELALKELKKEQGNGLNTIRKKELPDPGGGDGRCRNTYHSIHLPEQKTGY